LEKNLKYAEWALRIGMFLTFFGHGIFAVYKKASFITMLTSVLGISAAAATTLILWIGIIDIIVAIVVLFAPLRIILVWGIAWGFITALARPLAAESFWSMDFWDFVERGANFCLPLALLYLRGLPKTMKEWLS
jgi:hypothetical protein